MDRNFKMSPADLALYHLVESAFDNADVEEALRSRRTSGTDPYHKCERFEPDSSKFKMLLNVNQFRPHEIEVKTVDNFVVIYGRHEELADEHGFVSREFTRRYQLPNDVEPEKVKSYFSTNGILRIEAQRKVLEPPPKNERIVPITIQQH